jgi:NAD(P) transhydrogenase subunit beta
MSENFAAFAYLVSGVLFIMALRGLSHPTTSRQGNMYGMIGMAIAIVTTLLLAQPSFNGFVMIIAGLAIGGGAGAYIARKIAMTSMPQLVAGFHSLVGLAAVLVAAAALYSPHAFGIGEVGEIHAQALIEMSLGVAIGAITFTGSIIAFLKLDGRMSGKPIMLPMRHVINAALGIGIVVLIGVLVFTESYTVFWLIVVLSLILGVLIIVPIGGADMPVVVSMLNSYSGWAAAGIGFTLGNLALIITGALVGSSGAILSYIMCKGMNRSFISVILGGFGGETAAAGGDDIDRTVKMGSADDAAFLMANASKVIIVPGYGMAVAQAQHATRELADKLKENGVEVKYAIHPVAGRMPGHMNVLLAEANVPYDEVFELEDINSEFAQADVAYVIGANDVTNPAARDDKTSPIYGMPILDVDKAQTCLFVKRSLGSGYAGIDNTLFYKDGTMMLLGDAKKMTDDIVKAIDHENVSSEPPTSRLTPAPAAAVASAETP